jgi:hypothetical protein
MRRILPAVALSTVIGLTLSSSAQAASLTIPVTAITGAGNTIFNSIGFAYTPGSLAAGGIGIVNSGGTARSGVSPIYGPVDTVTFSFTYTLGTPSTGGVNVFLAEYSPTNTFVRNLPNFFTFTQEATDVTVTSRNLAGGLVVGNKYSLVFQNATPDASFLFSPVTLNVVVPEPVEAPVLCGLAVLAGAFVLRRRFPSVSAQDAANN